MEKKYAQENLNRIKFMLKSLPSWMRVPNRSRSDIKTYLELENGSRVDTFYPSSSTPPDNIARSLTIPILYLDEAAFVRHIETIYTAAQPTMSRAREQAKKNNYPHFMLITSTPNGTSGDGKFFYDMWNNAIESDNVFEYDENLGKEEWIKDNELLGNYMNDANKNSYLKVRLHWNEDPLKDEAWYIRQQKELNFNRRKINQDLNLVFLGGSHCIFDDDVLEQMDSIKHKEIVELSYNSKLEVYEDEIDETDYYLIGVDTAESLKGAFNAVEIFSLKYWQQVAEYKGKLGSLTKYGEIVNEIFQWLHKKVKNKLLLCIERNSIGQAIIEHLIYHVTDFNYMPYIFKEYNKDELGIHTGTRSKELMIAAFSEYFRDDPKCIKSPDLSSQLFSIERGSTGVIKSKGYSDMFMAACFTAYARKTKYLELMPMVDYTSNQLQNNILKDVKLVAEMSSQKQFLNKEKSKIFEQAQYYEGESIISPFSNDDEKGSFFFGF